MWRKRHKRKHKGTSKYYIDTNGYFRFKSNNKLLHRNIAYYNIYLPDRELYDKPFRSYVIHHIDGNKKNNDPYNLRILTQKDHELTHGISNGDVISPFEGWGSIVIFIIIILFLIFVALLNGYI